MYFSFNRQIPKQQKFKKWLLVQLQVLVQAGTERMHSSCEALDGEPWWWPMPPWHAMGAANGHLPWPTAFKPLALIVRLPTWSISSWLMGFPTWSISTVVGDSWASCALPLFIKTCQKELRPGPFMRTIISSSCPGRVFLSFTFHMHDHYLVFISFQHVVEFFCQALFFA
jgi:hypothetical protein